ncbi:hypothetical protein GIB67_021498 [Kingdonia uniflora]|uniref:Uncharacterized protein n=1 Tax=Kingdonia uniflora TaxID=39325 RepID=A0A7J7L9R6_9MAGN|nr:hypothetical protein GIB67_021498 [Kingdonia uniflora]
MCPLRIILLFLSATLTGYFAWKNFRLPFDDDEDEGSKDGLMKKKQELSLKNVCLRSFERLMVTK